MQSGQLEKDTNDAISLLESPFPFKYLMKVSDDMPPMLKPAIFFGWLEVIEHYIKKKKNYIASIRSMLVREIAHLGHLHILQYFFKRQHVVPSVSLLHIASAAGHVGLVKYLHEAYKLPLTVPENDEDYYPNYLIWILRKGHLRILKWLVANQKFSLQHAHQRVNLILEAHRYKHVPILEWLVISQGFYLSKEILEDLFENPQSWALIEAVFERQLLPELHDEKKWYQCLKWLKEKYRFALLKSKNVDEIHKIDFHYKSICAHAQKKFPLLNGLPNDLLQTVFHYIEPGDLFLSDKSLKWVSKRYFQFVYRPDFVAYKYKQYFGEEGITDYKTFFSDYSDEFCGVLKNKAFVMHACLTNNLSYSENITFDVLAYTYPSGKTGKLYSFLLNTNRLEGINQFISTLPLEPSMEDISYRRYPLITAVRLNQIKTVQAILKTGNSYIDSFDSDLRTALMWAIEHDYADIVKLLIENKADVQKKRSALNYSYLDLALTKRRLGSIPLLLKAYEKLPQFKHVIQYPMHLAAQQGYLDVVQVLYGYDEKENKQSIFEVDQKGRTPLLWAIINGHEEVSAFFLEKSLEFVWPIRSPKNRPLETPLDLACVSEKDTIKSLVAHYVYKYCQYLPCIILSKLKTYVLEFRPGTHTLLFTRLSNLSLLYKDLNGISSSDKGVLDKIKSMLEAMVGAYNVVVSSKDKTSDFLMVLIQDSLNFLFGDTKFLIQNKEGKLDLKIADNIWHLLQAEEANVLAVNEKQRASYIPKF